MAGLLLHIEQIADHGAGLRPGGAVLRPEAVVLLVAPDQAVLGGRCHGAPRPGSVALLDNEELNHFLQKEA